jgi:hypothetical protein
LEEVEVALDEASALTAASGIDGIAGSVDAGSAERATGDDSALAAGASLAVFAGSLTTAGPGDQLGASSPAAGAFFAVLALVFTAGAAVAPGTNGGGASAA